MSLRKISFVILIFIVAVVSCKKDDDGGTTEEEIRDRGDQQKEDKALLRDYLKTHYYNKSAFEENPNPKISDLKITDVAEAEKAGVIISDQADSLLINTVETKNIVFSEVDYEIYILNINKGGGHNSPSFSDNIDVIYEGFTLEGVVFDSRVSLRATGSDLLDLIFGWRKVIPEFNAAESFVEGADGTVNFQNHGTGLMFLPSGLAYFSDFVPGLLDSRYKSLAFKFELIRVAENDHDSDGIPSYLEDLYKEDGTKGSDGIFARNFNNLEKDDDTDGDGVLDYLDNDDDNDGVLTKDEIIITEENRPTAQEVRALTLASNQRLLNQVKKEDDGTYTGVIITFTDSDGDSTPDYLDADLD